MLVVNKEARHHGIGRHHTLEPGVNEVPDDVWSECKKIDLVQHYLKTGVFQEVRGAKGKPVTDITKMKADEAISLVKQTVNKELLTTWRSDAKGPLARAIDEQLKELDKKPDNAE